MTNKDYYKHPEYGFVYGESVPTPRGRLCWPYLVKPRPGMKQKDGTEGQARFEITIALAKNDPKVKTFLEYIAAETKAMVARFNEGRSAELAVSRFVKDGDAMDAEDYPYYQGCWVLCARNSKPVQIIDDAKGEIEASTIKGGMIGKLMVTPLITAHGLSYKLELVQFLKDDGVRFAGGSGGRDMAALMSKLDDGEESAEPTLQAEAEKVSAPSKVTVAPTVQAAVQKGKAALAKL